MTPERKEKFIKVLRKRQPDLTVVMENVHDPHNISAVMRSCDAVGVNEIYILNTNKRIEEKNLGARSSASAKKWIDTHTFDDYDECFEKVSNKYENIYATHLGVESKGLYNTSLTESTAIVLGNEKEGVSEEALNYCTGNIIIPQVGMIQSLNISVACAVILFEAFRQREQLGMYNTSRYDEIYLDKKLEEWSTR